MIDVHDVWGASYTIAVTQVVTNQNLETCLAECMAPRVQLWARRKSKGQHQAVASTLC